MSDIARAISMRIFGLLLVLGFFLIFATDAATRAQRDRSSVLSKTAGVVSLASPRSS